MSARARAALGVAAVAGLAGLGLGAGPARAADAADAADAVSELSGVDVMGLQKKADSGKYTAPLLNTPQTITVIDQKTLQAQNLLTLRDILMSVPGVTFGAGEGGGGYGDSINLRGYSANTDITTDGLRDSAQYTRSDPFNVDRIEVITGANSVYSGAGSVGGSINIVTKKPTGDEGGVVSGSLGTEGYARFATDAQFLPRETIALRLNLMAHQNDAPGRDVEKFERWGIAPSVTFGFGTPTQVNISYVHQEDDNIPQYGVPYYRNQFNGGPIADPGLYYGYDNIDKQEIKLDMITARVDHDFSENLSVRNTTRWQQVTQLSIVDPPQGTFCLNSGINPATGAACATPGVYVLSGPRGNVRDTKNKYLINQTDFTARFATGTFRHNLVVGAAFSHESFDLETGNVLRNPGGALPNPVLPNMNIDNPDHVWRGPINYVVSATQDGELDNMAVYAFETIQLSEQWEINAGVRFERNEGSFTPATVTPPLPNPPGRTVTQGAIQENEEDLFSYRVGLVYKPRPNGSIYVVYGNSKTPSKASVNGSCVRTSGGVPFDNCNVDPEEAQSYEIGTKWDVLDRRLSLTAAIFRNERSNFRVPSTEPGITFDVLDGKSRVDGVALGATGLITENWAVLANYTYLKSKILQSVSDFTLAQTGIDAQKGNPLANTPKHSFSLWTTYALPKGFTVGYGAIYTGEFVLTTGAPPLFKSPAYWTHEVMVAYAVNEKVDLQLNVKNIFDKEYYTRIRNNGWATPGDGRWASLTANYRF